jgi:bifunctional DNA-binding transcriptional regulator/antitoxin component of YhaV-PrlF toxin-antitoxin module
MRALTQSASATYQQNGRNEQRVMSSRHVRIAHGGRVVPPAEFRKALGVSVGDSRRNAELAMIEHGEREAARALPATCPYALDQIVGHHWYPANRHGLVDDLEGDAS